MSSLNTLDTRQPAVNAAAPRLNLYQSVHKGLRAFMADTLTKIGSTDPHDPIECAASLAQVRSLLAICQAHLEHENHFIHSAMERRQAGSAKRCAGEHIEHEAHIAQLGELTAAAEAANSTKQLDAWRELYQALSEFVAENFEHMLLEERQHNQILWQHYTDDELHQIHGALLASIPADEMAHHFRWMLPHLSHPERLAMLGGMQQGMPAPVFKAQMDNARSLLNPHAWGKLARDLSYDEVNHG